MTVGNWEIENKRYLNFRGDGVGNGVVSQPGVSWARVECKKQGTAVQHDQQICIKAWTGLIGNSVCDPSVRSSRHKFGIE